MAIVFLAETGRVLFATTSTRPQDMQALVTAPGQIVIDGFCDNATQYVLDGEVTERPALLDQLDYSMQADGLEAFEIDVPEGTLVLFQDEWHTITDGLFEFTTAVPGTYPLRIEPPFPFITQDVRIVAHEVS